MRMILPPIKERRAIDRFLAAFFAQCKASDFKKAISLLCRFYHLKHPKIEWFEYIDWGKNRRQDLRDRSDLFSSPGELEERPQV